MPTVAEETMSTIGIITEALDWCGFLFIDVLDDQTRVFRRGKATDYTYVRPDGHVRTGPLGNPHRPMAAFTVCEIVRTAADRAAQNQGLRFAAAAYEWLSNQEGSHQLKVTTRVPR